MTRRPRQFPKFEVEREVGGRWIAEAPEIPGAMAYGTTEQEAVEKATRIAKAGRLNGDPSGNSHRPSKRRDVLDEIPTAVRKKSTTKKKPPNFAKALADSTTYGEQIIKGDWEPRDERDLVGLYAALHRHVYGVDALELKEELGAARASCGKLLRDEFKGDPIALQTYLAWAMKRARDWKRSKERDGEEVVRVGWRLVFKNRKWLVDFLASQGRREASRPAG